MKTEDLFNILSEKITHRIDIYIAPSKIDTYFKDQGLLVSEVNKTDKEGAEFGASIFNVFSGKLTEEGEITEKLVIDSRDKGKIIERIANLETPTVREDNSETKRSLFNYKGPAHFTYWGETPTIYTPEENEIIQKERARQERIMQKDTALFTFKIKNTVYAAIANKENFDLGMLASYGPLASHCILGLPERNLTENIVLINPFWIWHEQDV